MGVVPESLDTIKPYIEAYNRSSERSRGTFFLIVVAAIIVVTTFLNTRHGGWIDQRVRQAALSYAAYEPQDSLHTGQVAAKADFQDALQKKGILTGTQLKDRLESLERINADAQLVRMPIVGVAFDVNDMGIVAGATLFFLSLMLLYANSRERDNLAVTFARARRASCLPDAYELLSMAEVLHAPPKVGDEPNPPRVDIPILMLFVPLIAQAIVVGYDLATTDYGKLLSAAGTISVMVIETIFFALLVVLAFISRRIILDTRVIWKNANEETERLLASDQVLLP